MIYTLTTLQANGTPRCVGYFLTEDSVRHTLHMNYGDLNEEGSYPLAVIEKVKPGLYPICRKVAWYRYQQEENKWMECTEPPEYKKVCNFGIG